MSVPTVSGPSTGTVAATNNTLTFAHTTEASKSLYLLVMATTFSGSGGQNDFAVGATFNSVDLVRKASWYGIDTNIVRCWIFSLVNPGVATANIVFDGSTLTTAGYGGISAM